MKLTIKIPGTIRIKKNSKRIFGKGKFKKVLPSKAYLKWEKYARDLIQNEIFRIKKVWFFPVDFEVEVSVFVFYKGPEPDLSGALESVGDCLEGIIWKNDKKIMSWDGSRKYHDKDNPRTEITIRRFKK